MKLKLTLACLLLLLTACSSTASGRSIEPDVVIKAWQEAGLEVEDVKDQPKNEFRGLAPNKFEKSVEFSIPSLGEDKGGQIFSYSDQEDLDEMKEYYEGLAESMGMLFNWTAAHHNILIQLNGDLSEEEFAEYVDVLHEL
ncbi:stress protein [Aureibacillus halotolerans]|uniref:Stress protein n=1 Tax=Aureibacillus halotolerans TaxID=1508390 RepID=A0A4V3D598_9BACI|nr:stress protein [Aureibacillus halotolerans]TDQ39257.1 hypothetical protein EV213_108209 [Aureibacillus halotolerans]